MSERLDRMPRKVHERALELGADEECLETNDPDLACGTCTETIYAAYDEFYGDLPDEVSVLMAIRNDLIAELDSRRA